MLQITFVDFVLYELLDQHLLFEPTILDDYPNLKVHSSTATVICHIVMLQAFLKRFEVGQY